MKWCALCGEELRLDSHQGWVHDDKKEGAEWCPCSTTSSYDWKAAVQREKRETESIAGKFAKALGCLADAACHLRDIDNQYNVLHPDDECGGFELAFWWAVAEAIEPLERIQDSLEAIEKHMPKEISA